jgi:hypothetical protein
MRALAAIYLGTMRSSAVSIDERSPQPTAAAAPPLTAAAPANSASANPSDLEKSLQALLERCQRLQAAQPEIVGLGQMRRRLQKEVYCHYIFHVVVDMKSKGLDKVQKNRRTDSSWHRMHICAASVVQRSRALPQTRMHGQRLSCC